MRKHLAWIRVALVAVMAMGFAAGDARAAAINLTTPGDEYESSFYTLGFEFTVSSLLSVNSLGVYDSGQDGLADSANVAIWLASGGAPLASVVVPAGVGGDLDGYFRYASIAPLLLTPNVHYVIGAFLAGDLATSFNTGQGGVATVDPLVTIVLDRFSNFDSAFGFPTETNGEAGAWLGADFRATAPAPVPEPATLGLLGLGLAAIRAARRRKA